MNLNNQATTFTGGGTINIGTALMGSSALVTENMTGVLNLQATNTTVGYTSTLTGGFTLTAGTLNFASAQSAGTFSAFTSGKTFTISSGTIDNTYGGALTLVLGGGSISIGGDFTFTGGSDLNLGTAAVTLTASSQITASSHNLTIGGIISGNFDLTKAGTGGTLTLSGANTYSGTTTLNAGTLQLGNSLALQSSLLTIGTGTLSLRSDSDTTFSTSGTIAIKSGTSPTIDVGHVTGGNLNHTLTLGNFKFNGTSTLNLTDTSADGYTAALGAGDLVNTRSTINSSANSSFISLSASGTTRTNTIFFTGTGTVTVGTINDDPVATAGNFEAVNMNNANGNLILTGASTYTGPTAIVAGTLTIGGAGQLGSGSYSANIGNGGAFIYNSSAAQILSGVISGIGTMTKSASGTLTLSGANTYTGNTTISGGTLALGTSGSINSTPIISLAAGATFDVSAISAYTLSSSTALSAAGTASAATINGASGGTVSLGSRPITLTYDGSHPALTLSQGTLQLNGNAFTVNKGTALASGTYAIAQQASGNITSSGAYPTVTGTAIDGSHIGTISVSSGNVNLIVDMPPLAVADSYSRAPGVGIKIHASDLLANDTDADSDTLTYVSCDATSAKGVSLGTSGSGNSTLIIYPSSAGNSTDSFHYTISDGHGGAASGTVSITINTTVTGQQATITVSGGQATLKFFGIPGYHYAVQRSPDISSWSDIIVTSSDAANVDNNLGYSVLTAPTGGAFTAVDGSAPGSSAYYRLRAAP
jgi:autotransporter-associated beta strand protein